MKNLVIVLLIAFGFFAFILPKPVNAATVQWDDSGDQTNFHSTADGNDYGTGADPHLAVGYINSFDFGYTRAYIKFTNSFSGIGSINSAILHIKSDDGFHASHGPSPTLYFDLVTSSWNENTQAGQPATTWYLNRIVNPTVSATNRVTATIGSGDNTWYTVNITNLVKQAFANGTFYGIRIVSDVENSTAERTGFWSQEQGTSNDAYIVVDYNPPPTPTPALTCTCYSGCDSCTQTTVTGTCSSNGLSDICPVCPPITVTPGGPPNCDSGITCDDCSVIFPACGNGIKKCTYTTYGGGGSCVQQPAPDQTCTAGCLAGYSCVTNACVCNAVSTPTGLTPSGNIPSGLNDISWNPVAGAASYILDITNLTLGTTDTFTLSGDTTSYDFGEGTDYRISVKAVSGCNVQSAAATVNVRILSTITVNVYNDLDGNRFQDPAEGGVDNVSVNVTGGGAGTYTTNIGGNAFVTNVPAGSSTISVTLPPGFTASTTNPVTVVSPPNQVVNFGIHPFPPDCVEGLTSSKWVVYPINDVNYNQSTLTVNGCPPGVEFTFYDNSIGDTVTNNNTNTSTWIAPIPFWYDTYANPYVDVCFTISGSCTSYTLPTGPGNTDQGIRIIPLFSIAGSIFVDKNKDGLITGDSNYTGSDWNLNQISISPNPGATITGASSGVYSIGNLPAGSYTVTYTKPNTVPLKDYDFTTLSSFTVTVGNTTTGTPCKANPPSTNAVCDNIADTSDKGNITNLAFGITNAIPWIQSVGGDITGAGISSVSSGALDNRIPISAINPYVSLRQPVTGTPGIVYLGGSALGSSRFGAGQPSQYITPPNPPYNWVIANDSYIPHDTEIVTSYKTILAKAKSPTALTTTQCESGGTNACKFSSGLINGAYTSGNLTLTGDSIFTGNKDYVILVSGDLNIGTDTQAATIKVTSGSTVMFTVSGNINIAPSVGTSDITSSTSQIEGYYSTDKNIIVKHDATKSCPTGDLKLNVAGSMVVNAARMGGSFTNARDLCEGDLTYPSFTITERPDFILNAPDLIKVRQRIWQEVAP